MSFPETIDSLARPAAGDSFSNSPAIIDAISDAVEALETKVGVDSSAVTSSHDYKIVTLQTELDAAELLLGAFGAIPWIAGVRYSYQNRGLCPLLSTNAPLADLIYAHPIYFSKAVTLNKLYVRYTAVDGSPGNFCIGVYTNASGAFRPDTLYWGGTASDIKTASAAEIDCTPASPTTKAFTPGWYWFAFICESGGSTLVGANTSTGIAIPQATSVTSTWNSLVKSQAWSGVTPLPSSFGTPSTSAWGEIYRIEFTIS